MLDDNMIEQAIMNQTKDLPDYNYLLGRGLTQPFSPANSGSRKLMYAIHRDHLLVQEHGEIPIVGTGFENEFGRHSSSYIEEENNYEVIAKIDKYPFKPGLFYYLIIRNIDTGEYDMRVRRFCKHNAESFGYLYNNKYMDSLSPGSIIHSGDVSSMSNGFDDYGNRLDGVNLVTMYLASSYNMEDSVILSKSARKKLSTILVKQTKIGVNDNHVMLNMYGDDNIYKAFPDIGEDVKNGIFCSIKTLENNNMLYTLSRYELKNPSMSSRNITIEGTVADINVYCNNPEALKDSQYNQQLYFYYDQTMQFARNFFDIVAPIAASNAKMSYDLKKQFAWVTDVINGRQFIDDKPFNNVVIEVTMAKRQPVEVGDKFSDRYGGKGVVSEIRPDNEMPVLDNGTIVDIIKNQSGCMNRENIGQLNEQSLTFMESRIIDYCKMGVLSKIEQAHLIYDFLYDTNPQFANFSLGNVNINDEEQARMWVDEYLDDGDIFMSIPPYTTDIDIDKLDRMYKKYSWIKPYTVYVPMRDSNGNVRHVKTRRPMVIGKIYHYRLKQYAEEKFSVTSLSATNIKNLNTKSKANKKYESRYSRTPIMFGAMEAGNQAHLGMEHVVANLMLYSSSPQARKLFEHLLTGDPYDIDIKLDKDSKNRNAEIINTIFKAMGLELIFEKIPKQKKYICQNVMCKIVPNKGFEYKTNIRDIIGHDDELEMKLKAAEIYPGKDMVKRVMCNIVDKKE